MSTPVKRAFREAFADNIVGTLINFPLQYAIIAACLFFGFGALLTTLICTIILFIIALIRKVWIRLHFEKRFNKANAQLESNKQL